ncbi:hypothetical protein C8Q74DRAFT_1223051 [Fomes fomentarius]|nr:hypothetical protein C8Q74DRAFT_1223051 [Fomes fomentarius]
MLCSVRSRFVFLLRTSRLVLGRVCIMHHSSCTCHRFRPPMKLKSTELRTKCTLTLTTGRRRRVEWWPVLEVHMLIHWGLRRESACLQTEHDAVARWERVAFQAGLDAVRIGMTEPSERGESDISTMIGCPGVPPCGVPRARR